MAKRTLAILGVGLMGGSIGLAVKKRRLPWRVIGIGRSAARLAAAKRKGALDEFSTDPARAIEADLVILCSAVSDIVPSFEKIMPHLKAGAWVSDIGSVKSPVMKEIFDASPEARFVGGHPLAGSEKTGAENARADLYEGATVALCPGPSGSKAGLKVLKGFWESLGAKPLLIEPDIHDILVAQTSHLPHVLAAALARLVSALNGRDARTGRLLAGSFRDMTRIADSDPRQWAEISAANQRFILGALKSYRDILLDLIKKFESPGTGAAEWEDFFSKARAGRRDLL
ncbi:MAG: hypothetical protein A3A86_00200 [Elusimicrobia bacterium RIFCSPLOWO2_01_FULL_60_11]|nr:MAG: hypothetical protein A3A86_00200 [Elusimicrobia bacterium RIFCSPLOWO2_01_FULL_60_11]